jgi:hypothetical protein
MLRSALEALNDRQIILCRHRSKGIIFLVTTRACIVPGAILKFEGDRVVEYQIKNPDRSRKGRNSTND